MKDKLLQKKFIFVAGLLFFYAIIVIVGIKGTSSNLKQHYALLESIQSSLQYNANLNENILRSRTFLLENYDPLVSDAKQLKDFCKQMMLPSSPLMASQNGPLQSELHHHCEIVDRKMVLIEGFKSTNSILKNSLRYIQVLTRQFKTIKLENESESLLNEIFEYNMQPSLEQRERALASLHQLEGEKAKVKNHNIKSLVDNVSLHLNILLRTTQDRETLEKEILSDSVKSSLNQLQDVYSRWHQQEEETATYYHYGLFVLSILLGVILLNTFNNLQEKSTQLVRANETLEDTVKIRTAELLKERNDLQRKQEIIEELQKTSVLAAHQAGMSEIATGVLHNVGNVLNSANVGLETIIRTINNSVISDLYQANTLLEQNKSRLAEFFTSDPRGKKLAQFYLDIGNAVKVETDRQRIEAGELMKKLQLIKDIISTQQTYAKGRAEFKEKTDLEEIVDNALIMLTTSLSHHDIKVVKKFSKVPPILAQKTKLVHVVLNLIKNAKEAMASSNRDEKTLTLEIGKSDEGHVFFKVTDTGAGISSENLNRVFTHGFTTKQTGHGFGLHFCANAATEMEAKMSVTSAGIGFGASFAIEFSETLKEAA